MPDKPSHASIQETHPQPLLGYAVIAADKTNTISLLDAQGKPVTDLQQRITLQETLVRSLIDSWQQDQAMLLELNAKPAVKTAAPARPKNPLQVGYKDEQGWCYAGISVTTGTPLWIAEKGDEKLKGSWNNIIKKMKQMQHFRDDRMSVILQMLPLQGVGQSVEQHLQQKDDGGVRLATIGELAQIYENKEDLGCCLNKDDWHWSLSEYQKGMARALSLKTGRESNFDKTTSQCLLYVKTEPRLRAPALIY